MYPTPLSRALLVTALLLTAPLAKATESGASAAGTINASNTAATQDTRSAQKSLQAAAKVKLIDINNARKAELKTLPGIKDAQADRIIAGRPYGSKAHLTTRDVLPRATYEQIKRLVIAGQPRSASVQSTPK